MTAAEIAALVGARVQGDSAVDLTGVAPLERATGSDLSFLSNPKYGEAALASGAGAILASSADGLPGRTVLVCDDPYAAFAKVLRHWYPPLERPPGVHPSAVVEPGASVHPTAYVGPFAVVGRDAAVGEGSQVDAGCVVGRNCTIGRGCHLFPRVVLYDDTELGDRVILHSGVVLGSDGFGYAQEDGRHLKIPQVGRVVVEDDVEIGANSTVDRGALEATRIGRGTKIDNLVMVAHNVHVGPHCILVAQSGISGSTSLGHHVIVAGQSGAVGHIRIGNGARVGAKSAVTHDLPDGAFVTGHPAQDHRRWLKERALSGRLEEFFRRLKRVEARMNTEEEHA
jgi:UDP-3-O-[3-hydroxymyristoyl] glucosamine N-acyltransferase